MAAAPIAVPYSPRLDTRSLTLRPAKRIRRILTTFWICSIKSDSFDIPPASTIFVPAAAGLTCASVVFQALINSIEE